MAKSCALSDYMSVHLVSLSPDMDILEAVRILTERGIPGAPVIDNLGNLVGLLAEKDCLKAVLNATYYGEWGGRVSEYMQTSVQTIDADISIIDAVKLLTDSGLRGFPVMQQDRVVGQLNRSDILKALLQMGLERFAESRNP
jgi:predicted transcriptional regulator